MNTEIDIFGEFLMENLRDVAIALCNGLADSKFDSPGHREIQSELQSLTPSQKEAFKKAVTYCVDGGINDFLYRLDKESRTTKRLDIQVNGRSTSELCDGLSKQLHGATGWKARFSKSEPTRSDT